METITVNARALREILQALNGPPHYIREIQAIRNLSGSECPISKLTEEYNSAVEKYYEISNNMRNLQAVAQAADELMATLGADGEIDTLHPKTQILLDALYAWRSTFIEGSNKI